MATSSNMAYFQSNKSEGVTRGGGGGFEQTKVSSPSARILRALKVQNDEFGPRDCVLPSSFPIKVSDPFLPQLRWIFILTDPAPPPGSLNRYR